MKKIFCVIASLFIGGCASNYPPLQTVDNVDLERYLGTWYEIASFPASFQEGCNCTSAEYKMLDKETIRVINSCRRDSTNGELDIANGKAWIVEGSNNSKLKVSFFWPFKGDYYIIALDEKEYHYAMVGTPSRKYCWILCREKTLDESVFNELVNIAKDKGFDTSKFRMTTQTCDD